MMLLYHITGGLSSEKPHILWFL